MAPFFLLVLCTGSLSVVVAVIGVDVEVTQPQGGLAVFDKTSGACLLRDNPYGHCQGQGGLVHVSLLSFLIFVFLWSRV
ncbi:hypothetical protein D3C86_2014270 [compost metagenome]